MNRQRAMLEGLWVARFHATAGTGGGVVVLANGKVLGGDSQFTYIGTYSETAPGQMEARIRCGEFNKIAGMQSVFGPLTSFELLLKGEVRAGQIVLNGHVHQQPRATIRLELTKVEDLGQA